MDDIDTGESLGNRKHKFQGRRACVIADTRWMSYRVLDGPKLLVLITPPAAECNEDLFAMAKETLYQAEAALALVPEGWQYAGVDAYARSTGDGNGYNDYTVYVRKYGAVWRVSYECVIGKNECETTYPTLEKAMYAAYDVEASLFYAVGRFTQALGEAGNVD